MVVWNISDIGQIAILGDRPFCVCIPLNIGEGSPHFKFSVQSLNYRGHISFYIVKKRGSSRNPCNGFSDGETFGGADPAGKFRPNH